MLKFSLIRDSRCGEQHVSPNRDIKEKAELRVSPLFVNPRARDVMSVRHEPLLNYVAISTNFLSR